MRYATIILTALALACGSASTSHEDAQRKRQHCPEMDLVGERCVRYFDPATFEPPHCGTIMEVDCDGPMYLFGDDNFSPVWIDGADMTCPIPGSELCDAFPVVEDE